jgi:hypothetical protein
MPLLYNIPNRLVAVSIVFAESLMNASNGWAHNLDLTEANGKLSLVS